MMTSRWDRDDEADLPAPSPKRSRPDSPAEKQLRAWTAAGDAAQTAFAELSAFQAAQRENAALEQTHAAAAHHKPAAHPSRLSDSDSPLAEGDADLLPHLAEGGGEEEPEPRVASPVWNPPNQSREEAAPGAERSHEAAARVASESRAAAAAAVQAAAAAERAALEAGRDADAAASLHGRPHKVMQACRSVEEYEKLNHIDEGTYGVVFRARERSTGRIVALKKVKMEKEKEGFPLTSVREINILLALRHPNIVTVFEVVVGRSLDSIFMVMEFMEHDLKGLLESQRTPFTVSEVKCLLLQLLSGVAYLHDHYVLHRDLKTSNVLVSNRGDLKLCDFGMARQYGSPLKPYTNMVVTLWYRPPELLLGVDTYSTAVDCWSLGCCFAELVSRSPLLPGRSEIEQLDRIFKMCGTPNEATWAGWSRLPLSGKMRFANNPPGGLRARFPARPRDGAAPLSDAGFDLLSGLLCCNPGRRISASDALRHPWFSEVPLAKERALMPTQPSVSAGAVRPHHARRDNSPDAAQEAAARREMLGRHNGGGGGLFAFAG